MDTYKVALVSDWYYPKIGGIEYAINALGRNLQALGHEVHVITRQYDNVAHGDTLDDLPIVRLARNPTAKFFPSPNKLSKILQAGHYDIIHVHGLDSPMAMMSLLLAKRVGIPRVLTNHSLLGDIPLRLPLLMACKGLLRSVDAVIAVSSAVEQESAIMSKGPVYKIPNGVDTLSPNGTLQTMPLDTKGKIVVATVSRMTKKKSGYDLVQIAPALLAKHKNLLFLMIGDGPLRRRLENKVKQMKLTRNFLFTGEISRATVLQLLEKADIFVLPSKREAFGISILEAFLKRTPVVARNHSGVSDIINHEQTGLLADNKYEMAKYLEKLITSTDLAESLSTAAFTEIAKYQWPDIARRVQDVYSRVIHEKHRAHC
jgi:glycosyltransferase involved in cell wall biosynthesis